MSILRPEQPSLLSSVDMKLSLTEQVELVLFIDTSVGWGLMVKSVLHWGLVDAAKLPTETNTGFSDWAGDSLLLR